MIVDNNNLPELPKGWATTTIGDLTDKVNPGFPSGRHNRDREGIPHIRPMNINLRGEIDLSDVKYVETKSYDVLKSGDILFNNTNSPALVGKTALIKKNTDWAYSNHMTRIRLREVCPSPAWVAYYLHTLCLRGYFRTLCVHHVNQASVNSTVLLGKVAILLAPLNEQKRIVSKIEELFTRLDAGVEALKKVKAELKRYRQAVLKYAFEGKLTAEWRKKNKGKLEPASKLLERIAKKREKSGKSKARKLPLLDTSNFPELPEGWEWAEFADISTKITDGEHIRPKTTNSGVRFLSAKDVRENGVVLDGALYVSVEDAKKYRKRCDPESGDILIVSRGATVGRSCIVNITEKFCLLGSVILMKLSSLLNNKYVSYTIKSSDIHRKLFLISGSTAQQAIYLRDIKRVTIPFCSLPEQNKIVAEIERHFSIADEVEQTIERSLKEADRLRQSILKRAFEGKLVSQDANDEPAEVLLERIRQQKEQQQTKVKVRPKKVKIIKRNRSPRIYFRRGAVISYIVDNLCDNNTFGRTQLEKMAHLSQYHLGIDLEFEFTKKAAGPFDKEIIKVESLAAKQGWFKTHKRKGTFGYYYRRGENIGERCSAAATILGSQKNEMDRLISFFNKMDTDQAEIFDTVYAVWNDMLIDGIEPTEDKIKEGFYAWSDEKKRFTSKQIHNCIEWIKDNGFVPTGTGLKTQAV